MSQVVTIDLPVLENMVNYLDTCKEDRKTLENMNDYILEKQNTIDAQQTRIKHQEKDVYDGLTRIEELSTDTFHLNASIKSSKRTTRVITIIGALIIVAETIIISLITTDKTN